MDSKLRNRIIEQTTQREESARLHCQAFFVLSPSANHAASPVGSGTQTQERYATATQVVMSDRYQPSEPAGRRRAAAATAPVSGLWSLTWADVFELNEVTLAASVYRGRHHCRLWVVACLVRIRSHAVNTYRHSPTSQTIETTCLRVLGLYLIAAKKIVTGKYDQFTVKAWSGRIITGNKLAYFRKI